MNKMFLLTLFCTVSMSLFAWENHDWLMDYSWYISDGRELDEPDAGFFFFRREQAPYIEFNKFEIPENSVLYQCRLRTELFWFFYQREENKNWLFQIGTTSGNRIYETEFRNNFSRLILTNRGRPSGTQDRVGQQLNPDYPLVGIWGRLPNLTEYRLVDPVDVIYYFEIDRPIPAWAVRDGTYLLRQIGDNVFETVSSFPDGRMRLEILDENTILMTPLFELPEADGLTAPLALNRTPKRQDTQ